MLVRPLMTNFKATVRDDCAVSVCSAPSSIYKNSCPLIVSRVGAGGEVSLWTGVRPPLHPQVAGL